MRVRRSTLIRAWADSMVEWYQVFSYDLMAVWPTVWVDEPEL